MGLKWSMHSHLHTAFGTELPTKLRLSQSTYGTLAHRYDETPLMTLGITYGHSVFVYLLRVSVQARGVLTAFIAGSHKAKCLLMGYLCSSGGLFIPEASPFYF